MTFLCALLLTARVTADPFALGTTNRIEGPEAGLDSVVLAVTAANPVWSATANDPWLHLDAANSNGAGSTNVVFSFDPNPGVTRVGTLSVAGQTLTVTQAGATYVPVPSTTLVSSGLNSPRGLAVDGAGNVYIADYSNNAIKEWVAASNTVTTLVSSGLNGPFGVAVDGAGNVYFADSLNNAIKKWTAVNGLVATLVSSGLNTPLGVAVDGTGNVYIADSGNNAIKEWTAANGTVSALVSSGLNVPRYVAVDAASNVYIDDAGNNVIKEWAAAKGEVTPLATGLSNNPRGVAVDGGGNVYIVGNGNGTINEWTVASGTVATLPSPRLDNPTGVAVDSAGNVYIVDNGINTIVELPRAFVDPTTKLETAAVGSDSLPAVLPYSENLSGPFAPTSDQPWLTITGVTNGVVSYALDANTYLSRTGHLTVLGVATPVVQSGAFTAKLSTNSVAEPFSTGTDSVNLIVSSPDGPWTVSVNVPWLHLDDEDRGGQGSKTLVFTFDANSGPGRIGTITVAGQMLAVVQESVGDRAIGTTNRTEGPEAGLDSVVLSVPSPSTLWMATANAPWLHLNAANSNGAGSANVVFSFDANPGATRVGTLTIDGQTLTINQAGKGYTLARPVATLPTTGPSFPVVVALDSLGHAYIGYFCCELGEWNPEDDTTTALLEASVRGIAVDPEGNLFWTDIEPGDSEENSIKKRFASDGSIVTLVGGLSNLSGLALDRFGNIYFTDRDVNWLRVWNPNSGTVVNLITSGLNAPQGPTVDAAGNVYFADIFNNAVKMWSPVLGTVSTLVSTGLNQPGGVAVDGSGNVYISDTENNSLKIWKAADGTVQTLASDSIQPNGVTVDGSGNVFFADNISSQIKELVRAFVDASPISVFSDAGQGQVPVVLPATTNLRPPFAPTSDQPWLSIVGITNGVVNYAFTTNASGSPRTGHLTVLGQSIPIGQLAVTAPVVSSPVLLPDARFQFGFSGTPGGSYSVLFSTNVTLPTSAWTPVGPTTVTGPGQFQFAMKPPLAVSNGFYRITSP